MNSYIVTLQNIKNLPFVVRVQGLREEDTLSQLQEEVGGYIELANYLVDDLDIADLDCWVCDDATGKPATLSYRTGADSWINIYGNLCFTKHDQEGGTIGMSIEESLHVIAFLIANADTNCLMNFELSKDEYDEWSIFLDANTDIKTTATA